MAKLSNYLMFFDIGMPGDLARLAIEEMNNTPEHVYEHHGVQLFSNFSADLFAEMTPHVQSAIGNYTSLTPDYVLKHLQIGNNEAEHFVLKRIPAGLGETDCFDNYGSPKRRLAVHFHMNTTEGGEIGFDQVGVETLQNEGHCTICPYSWQYSYTAAPAKTDQYILTTYLRIKDETNT